MKRKTDRNLFRAQFLENQLKYYIDPVAKEAIP